MGATLEQLFHLQEIETQLVDHRRRLDTRRRQIRSSERRIEQCSQEHDETLNRARDRQVAADAIELQIKTNDAEVTKLREALNSAKSNREYAAILTQINTTKADNTKEEEIVLQMMSETEAIRSQADAQLEQQKKEKRRLAELESDFKAFESTINTRVADLQKRRDGITAELPAELVKMFDRVAAKHDGEGLAEAVQDNPRRAEFSCGGCSMAVTLEQINRIQSHDEVSTCNYCGRILHLSNNAHSAV